MRPFYCAATGACGFWGDECAVYVVKSVASWKYILKYIFEFTRKNITDCSNEIDKKHLSGKNRIDAFYYKTKL